MIDAVAVIPARGGSKGIPRKNLQVLQGKPLIVWTIEQALAVEGLRVVVSTEDDEIAAVSSAAGAEVVPRPIDLAQDTTATEPVVLHTLDVLAERGDHPAVTMLLQATSPVRHPGTLQRALDQFEGGEFDSLVGVVPSPPFLWGMATTGEGVAHWDWQHRRRRQDMAPTDLRYRETGSVYVTRTSIYRDTGNRVGGRIGLFVMDEDEGIDIDTLFDLQTATSVMAHHRPD
ncbi:cytidylyltransferase domain-containing protein [Aestuariimicrobium soli]|uniref:acylneuraminate cytidylyltransferase family protein n=1 Tax=Aestuariimicrobium soli TaxID=2035834 RepID=UPI003EC07D74